MSHVVQDIRRLPLLPCFVEYRQRKILVIQQTPCGSHHASHRLSPSDEFIALEQSHEIASGEWV